MKMNFQKLETKLLTFEFSKLFLSSYFATPFRTLDQYSLLTSFQKENSYEKNADVEIMKIENSKEIRELEAILSKLP